KMSSKLPSSQVSVPDFACKKYNLAPAISSCFFPSEPRTTPFICANEPNALKINKMIINLICIIYVIKFITIKATFIANSISHRLDEWIENLDLEVWGADLEKVDDF